MPAKSDPEAVAKYLDLATRLLDSYRTGPRETTHPGDYELPQMAEVMRCVDEARALLFPGYVGDDPRGNLAERLAGLAWRLHRQVYRGLHHRCHRVLGPGGVADVDCVHCADAAERITVGFMSDLPELRDILAADVSAAYEGDPAATGTDEVIFCYPGVVAITAYRIANRLLRRGALIIPRMITEHAHEKTGIDIHPGATIGRSFFIDHGTGIVVGETSVIGDRVRIYQGVTLGALSLPRGKARDPDDADGPAAPVRRHPTIDDEVIIYANATILGGDTVIGRGAVIGGNCWVTRSVAAGARVTVSPAPAPAPAPDRDRDRGEGPL